MHKFFNVAIYHYIEKIFFKKYFKSFEKNI